MKTIVIATGITLILAGCASSAAYTQLAEAQRVLELHSKANISANLELVEGGQSEPEIMRRRALAKRCETEFYDGFTATLDQAAGKGRDGLIFAVGRSNQLQYAFDNCERTYGLTGFPEFNVGGTFMRPPAFVRSYYEAGEREFLARQALESESQANAMGIAAGLAGAARAAEQATQNTPVVIFPTYQPPQTINCTSYAYGLYVNTTCR